MKEYRWLLPFSQRIDARALETALCMAKSRRAKIIAVSIISRTGNGHGAEKRLEDIRRAKDFIELTGTLAARYHVPIERHEVFTLDVSSCLPGLIHDLRADAIVIAVCEGQGRLLSTADMKRIVIAPPAPLVLIRLRETPPSRSRALALSQFFSWLSRQRRDEEVEQMQHLSTPLACHSMMT